MWWKISDRSCLTTTVMGSWTWGKPRSCWDVSGCGQMKSRCNWSSFHIYIKTFKNVSKKTHGGKWTINILRSKHQVNAIHYILKYFQKDSGHGGSCELWHYGLLNIILRISQVKKEECLRFNGWSFSSWSWSFSSSKEMISNMRIRLMMIN